MYEQDSTTNTWACMNAIPISKAENAIIKLNGNNATIKYKKPEFIILYVKPLKMFNNMWPDNRSTNLSFGYLNEQQKLLLLFSSPLC